MATRLRFGFKKFRAYDSPGGNAPAPPGKSGTPFRRVTLFGKRNASVEEIGQVIVELCLQLFFEVFADAIWRRLPEPVQIAVNAVLSVGVAILLGWLSSTAFPKPFIALEALRIAYLVVVPLLLGYVMSLIGGYFSKRDKARSTLESFGFGWLFAFSFALTRYFATT